MVVKNYIKFRLRAKQYASAAELIKYVSTDTYNRIGFVKNHSKQRFMRIHEVTLTQNLVYEIYKFELETGLKLVDIYEAKDEKTQGADLLVCMQVGTRYLKIPMQAKILTPFSKAKDGRYYAYHHSNKYGVQSTLLRDYAKKCGSYLPIYLLYNYTFGSSNIASGEQEFLYGCSYMDIDQVPKAIKAKSNMRFSDLHPFPAKPWYHMFTKGGGKGGGNVSSGPDVTPPSPDPDVKDPNDDIKEFYKRFGRDVDDAFISTLKFYSHEELAAETEEWSLISPASAMENLRSGKDSHSYRLVFLPQPVIPVTLSAQTLVIDGLEDGLDIDLWQEQVAEY